MLPPPHFRDGIIPVSVLKTCFGSHIPDNMLNVSTFLLASVVHHRRFLFDTMPASHPLFTTPLFTQSGLLTHLATIVDCCLPSPTCYIPATGLSPIAAVLRDLAQQGNRISSLEERVDATPQLTVEGVTAVLEERAVQANVVTRHGLQDLLLKVITDAGVVDVARRLRDGQVTLAPANHQGGAVATAAPPSQLTCFDWGDGRGKCNRLPLDFNFPRLALSAWQYYCCGDPAKGFVALRYILPGEIFNI